MCKIFFIYFPDTWGGGVADALPPLPQLDPSLRSDVDIFQPATGTHLHELAVSSIKTMQDSYRLNSYHGQAERYIQRLHDVYAHLRHDVVGVNRLTTKQMVDKYPYFFTSAGQLAHFETLTG